MLFVKKVVFTVLCFAFFGFAQAQKLAEFNLNNFEDWTYTRSSVELNSNNICTNKVNLYGNYKLVSPLFGVKTVKYVRVQVMMISKDYAQSKYNLSKASPTMELLNEQGEVVATKKHTYSKALPQQEFVDYLAVPEGANKLMMRISAPTADANSADAIHEVVLTASYADGNSVVGDVNGDGVCDVSDVTDVINIILEENVTNDAADINGDGNIDVTDVTALINKILQ